MKHKNHKFTTMHALLLASCLGIAYPAYSGPEDVIQQVSVSQEAMQELMLTSNINLKFAVWFPRTANDVRNYFSYHKDVEVYQMMLFLNSYLEFGLEQSMIERHSYYHDLPKVMSLNELKHYGYKGWQPDIAEDFLVRVLNVSVEDIRRSFTKNQFGNYDLDLATRLLFSFGLSDATIAKLYPNDLDQKIIKQELKNLRDEINRIEDLVIDTVARASYFDSLSSEQQKKMKFLEYLSDFSVRTENKLAMLEYFKEFVKSSVILEEQRERIEEYRSLDEAKKPKFLEKYMSDIFVYVILEKQVGREMIDRFGLDGLVEIFKVSEQSYATVLQNYVINTRNNQNERRKTLVPRTINFGEMILKEFQYQREKQEQKAPKCQESSN